MSAKLFLFSFLLIISLAYLGNRMVHPSIVKGDEYDDLTKQIEDLNKLKKLSEDATSPLEKQVGDLNAKINTARAGINKAKKDTEVLATDINKREGDLAVYYALLAERVKSQYKQMRVVSPLMILADSTSASDLTKGLMYHEVIQGKNQELISSVGEDLMKLENDKKALEDRQKLLANLEIQLDAQADFFKGEIAKAKDYQKQLSGKIAEMSAKQQSILAARSGSVTTSVGDVPLADDFNASIGFKAQAPSNSFALFSFGAYSHRHGMSQYGAKKQGESGKSYKDIIQWYYGHGVKKDDGMPGSINVQGYGEMSFQKYLYGIAEMPSSWNAEALKAQAVAARSYAKKAGKPICTTEACQVFNKGKSDNPPEAWKKAVDDTEKEIIEGDVSAQYSSTAGGYITTSGWDTTDRSGEGNWSSRAWESMANSPWFYKSWYRNGYTSSGANCGRNSPWLSQEEMSDILNAWIVRKNANGADTGRIIPVTINTCNIGGGSGNPYSMDELKNLANNSGGAVTSISSVSVSNNNSGQTTSVTFQTNRGSISISGEEFKSTFNIRAPGYLRIPQSGYAFFNVEHKQ